MSLGINKKIIFILTAMIFIIGFAGVFNTVYAATPTDAQLISYIQSRVSGFDPSGIDRANLEGIARNEFQKQGLNNNQISAILSGDLPLPGSTDGGNIGNGGTSGFVPLAPIPGVTDTGDTSQFFNGMFTLGIIIAGFLAVIMIAVGGIQYMSTDAVSGKGEGRERITYALMGLLLILFSYILLRTINPDILQFNLFN